MRRSWPGRGNVIPFLLVVVLVLVLGFSGFLDYDHEDEDENENERSPGILQTRPGQILDQAEGMPATPFAGGEKTS